MFFTVLRLGGNLLWGACAVARTAVHALLRVCGPLWARAALLLLRALCLKGSSVVYLALFALTAPSSHVIHAYCSFRVAIGSLLGERAYFLLLFWGELALGALGAHGRALRRRSFFSALNLQFRCCSFFLRCCIFFFVVTDEDASRVTMGDRVDCSSPRKLFECQEFIGC